MKKQTKRVVALLIFIPTLILFLISIFVQPLLPAPWNNVLIIFGVVVAAVLAALSGINDTIQLAEKLSGEEPEQPHQVQKVKGKAQAIQAQEITTLHTGDLNINLVTQETATAFLSNLHRSPANAQHMTAQYLAYLVNRYRYLEFKGMGVSDRVPLKLALLNMYVPLQARIEMPEGETWARQLPLAGRKMSAEEAEATGRRLSEPRPVLELLQQNPGLIILGDPGAGKTTFLKYLALRLALGQEIGIGQRLPVLLPLSAYANALAQKDIALPDFIATYYQGLVGDELPIGTLLDAALQDGRALLLLDGLDEVKETARRLRVVERVEQFFSFRQQQGNKFILTSRIVGYKEVRPTAAGFAECTLVDFDQPEIEQFVTQWTTAVEHAAQPDPDIATTEAAREKAELLKALTHNSGVRKLAANPLLLTILAMMKRQGITLPDRRVQLYDQYVNTLLKHWNLARGLDRTTTRDLDEVEAIRVLAPLALWMHETSPGVGLVKQNDLRRKLIAIYTARGWPQPEQAAKQLLKDARDYAGLLVERGQGTYGFIHLTFQEYLAAVGIVQKGQSSLQPVVDLLAQRLDDDNWHEVILLAIGHLGIIQQRDEAAGQVLQRLVDQAPGTPGQAEIIAGEAVADTWPGGVTLGCRQQIIQSLRTAMQDDTRIQPFHRAKAGQILARVGDPREHVMTIDAMPFCYIPPGPFWMGSEDGNKNETPQHWLDIPYGYWLSQYPITNAQFQAFMNDGGYQQSTYWEEAKKAKVWQNGKVKGWLEDEPRNRPVRLPHPFNLPNHPVVGITWYEALAFTRWLTAKWHKSKLPHNWHICLPSEAEWEKAAQGGAQIPVPPIIQPITALKVSPTPTATITSNDHAQTRFIWGDDLNPNLANYEATDIKTTSAVGCFPGGISPYGLHEMSGNMFEWTRSKDAPYEYKPDDGREQLDASDDIRIMRGGFYGDDDGTWLRCACRGRRYPHFVYYGSGMRLCLSPISPSL